MRTQEQVNKIKSRIIDPYAITKFLSTKELNYLVNIFENDEFFQQKVYKNTGPVIMDLRNHIDDPVVSSVFERIKQEIGPYEITAAFFFQTNCPHVIHNDDLFQLPDGIYRAITLPLKVNRIEESTEIPKLCFFDQFYFQGPSKFFKGSEQQGIETYYNQKLYNYADVDGLLDHNSISEQTYKELFTHLEPQWLDGLSLHSTLDWRPGSALIFDSTRLHAASDFRSLGIESKLAISVFTTQIKEDAPIKFYEVPSTEPVRSVD
jgi:hypothetical protein